MPKVTEADIVVAIDYGANRDCTALSPAGIRTLEAALAFLNEQHEGEHVLVHCNADIPEKGMVVEDSARWKQEIVERLLRVAVERAEVPATTTITEARNICGALAKAGIKPRKIIIPECDLWHSFRVSYVWKRVFPGIPIEILGRPRIVRGEDYAQSLLRSPIQWPLVNVVGLAGMIVLGMNRVANIKQP